MLSQNVSCEGKKTRNCIEFTTIKNLKNGKNLKAKNPLMIPFLGSPQKEGRNETSSLKRS
jgi:hypothetical protein